MNPADGTYKEIAILGSTGSIGTQTLDIIAENRDRFGAGVLTALNNWEMLAEQARKFRPRRVVIANKEHYGRLSEALRGTGTEVEAGDEAVAAAAAMPGIDTVVTAMVGYSGLVPTIHAIGAGKRIALANKETLVVAGELITRLLSESQSEIIPVDSEHSAIFQCLVGEDRRRLRNIILTASGGPFRRLSADQLSNVTAAQALRHPNWDMGAKVTIDSASMMNKGFEMIEARWLFNCPPEQIRIAVHPESVVHSMVEFCDGSVKAQLGVPDMHLPISYALGYPERLASQRPALDLMAYGQLTFEEPDMERFPLLRMAFEAIARGGNVPCALNAANEIAVAAFLKGRIRFTDMPLVAERTVGATPYIADITLPVLIETNAEARRRAEETVASLNR